ncbi:DUF5655 domain-containing protein [Spirochaeta cellobiosiphila]|uniref:DUF5655 domain-containing protein n=1 Tax=Spirochaeta cellobiosiphila TaxID=504483 RepID=UPI0012EB15B7|nr:DUF5655 domain-containing protein [Spirochaeta cellobiosiphila]
MKSIFLSKESDNMLIELSDVYKMAEYIHFYQEQHQQLSLLLIERLSAHLDFKLKIQKATVHFVKDDSFAVIGLRRSKASIFVEFHVSKFIKNPRVEKTLTGRKGQLIHRVTVHNGEDIDETLLTWIKDSYRLNSDRSLSSHSDN